jgi:hypothetical protein
MYINSPGHHLGPHNSSPCGPCGGTGYTTYWVPDPKPRTHPVGEGSGHGGTESSAQGEASFFPGVDEWFERTLPGWLVRWISLSGAVVCATLAGIYAEASGLVGAAFWGVTTVGGFLGLLVLPLFILAVKLALLSLVLAILGVIGWVVYVLFTGS